MDRYDRCERCNIEILDWDLNKINLHLNDEWVTKKVCPKCFNKLYYMMRDVTDQIHKQFWEKIENN